MAHPHLLSPAGFRASGAAAKIKTNGLADVGLLVCDVPAAAAAAFTTNRVFAAPVKVGRQHAKNGLLRGIVMNSGNANACTGKQGERDALRMCQLAARALGCAADEFLPSSTGIIGHFLPMDKVERGIASAAASLGSSLEHADRFVDAIMTTDTRRKAASAYFKLGRQQVCIAGVAKGAGMIGPRMSITGPPQATLLSYITTDVKAPAARLRAHLQSAVESSFNSLTIDDHMSTNDTAVLLASGASGAAISTPRDAKKFADALADICQALAFQIAADGEGATKVVQIRVDKARTAAHARAIAHAIADSPLVKCALHGNDPNWGRILSAAGYAGVPFKPETCELRLAGAPVYMKGRPVPFNPHLVSESLRSPEVHIHLTCNSGKAHATFWTCDLSKEYISINADYHT